MKIKPLPMTTYTFINTVKAGDLIYWRRKGWRYIFSYIIRFFSRSLASHVVIVKEVIRNTGIDIIQAQNGFEIQRGSVMLNIIHQTFFGLKEDFVEFVMHDNRTFINSYCLYPREKDIAPYTAKNIAFYYTPLLEAIQPEYLNKMQTQIEILKKKKIKYAFGFLPLTLNWFYKILPNFLKRRLENRFLTGDKKICTSFVVRLFREIGFINPAYLGKGNNAIPTPQELMEVLQKKSITNGVFRLK